jgi:hypothetical protein
MFGLPVDRKVIFSNHKDLYKKKVENRQRKLIIKSTFLKPFMRPDEKILLSSTGYSPTTLFEKLLIGWIFVYLKRSLLVFTNHRIIHVPTTPIYRYRNVVAEIPYAGCRSIRTKGRSLLIKYKSKGAFEKFFGISGKEIKKIRQILKKISMVGNTESQGHRVHLCPQCAAPLEANTYRCTGCELKFKPGWAATVLAILFPGGGYFYLRQVVLGILAAVVEILLAAFIVIGINDMLNGLQTGIAAYLWWVSAAVLLVVEKALAVIHVNVLVKEFIPRKRHITFRRLGKAAV